MNLSDKLTHIGNAAEYDDASSACYHTGRYLKEHGIWVDMTAPEDAAVGLSAADDAAAWAVPLLRAVQAVLALADGQVTPDGIRAAIAAELGADHAETGTATAAGTGG